MLLTLHAAALGAPTADLVSTLPGFNATWPFKVYSGYLSVPGPFELNDYDSLSIHYQFHTSQRDPTKDPLVTWHQGGPGGSSINVGLYTEMGYFSLDDKGGHANPYAWNKVANMLYLESPAGSGGDFAAGSSECLKGGKTVRCHWDDVSQGEAYAHTLAAFHKAFPEFSHSDLYLTGESYFGQYGPNIANYILTHAPFNSTLNLKGIAAGNACWGGSATSVSCNGPNSERNDLEMYYGKGLISKKLYTQVHETCGFGSAKADPFGEAPALGLRCELALMRAFATIGPHNVYFIYDTCPLDALEQYLNTTGKSFYWLHKALRTQLATNGMVSPLHEHLLAHPPAETVEHGRLPLASYPGADGGFSYGCGGEQAVKAWLKQPDVRTALHLKDHGSGFGYSSSGPASITLWPFLASKIRVLIYNGDADACVPYKGNEEWIDGLETKGVLAEKEAWRPWFETKGSGRAPAGYVTSYSVPAAPSLDFSFVTIRVAGHMVPTFQPAAALAFFQRFLDAEPF